MQSQEEKLKQVYDAINKETSSSLKNKLLYIEKLNEERIKFQEDTHEQEYIQLKGEYDIKYQELYREISKIITGETIGNVPSDQLAKYKINQSSSANPGETGIPNYWGTALKHVVTFFPVNERDEEILKHLKDVRINNHEDKLSFTVEFVFDTNEYFTNTSLTKTYLYQVKDQECHKIESSTISWTSPDKIPNKIIKTKNIKSKFNSNNT
jgi:nucleosome assembly protein 1-like 1